jgi:mutator protein MutT
MFDPACEPARVLRHCPRCGERAVAPRRGCGYGCGACGFVFFLNVAAAVAAIIRDPEGRVLLTRRAHDPAAGKLDVPGGFVDPGETAEDALRREIIEELGLVIEDVRYFCSVTNVYEYDGLNYRTLDLYFLCRATNLSEIRAADDISGYAFVDPRAIDPAEVAFDSILKGLRSLVDSGV